MAGLSPQQTAAINTAIQQYAVPGQTGNGVNAEIQNYLTSSGLFTPAQLQEIPNDQIQGSGQFGSNVPDQTWASQIENAIGAAPSAAAGSTSTGLPTPAAISGTPAVAATATTPAAPATTGTAPAPLNDFGATPSVTPTYAAAATVDPNQQYGYLQAQEAANAQSLQPTFQNQDQQNQDQLAARGISSSGAAQDLTNQLYQAQGATLAGMNSPAIQQQSGYTQGDISQNQANQQAVNLANAGAGNVASATNAGYYNEGLTGNANAYNNYLSTLENQGYNTGNEGYEAYLGSFGPNPGVTGGYNTALGQTGSAYGNAYGTATQDQNSALTGLGSAAGNAAAAGAFG